jgi:hypothetical protein
MIQPLTEYIANRTVRVTYADGYVHNFLLVWDNNILNVIWSNTSNGIVSINGSRVNELLIEEEPSFPEKDIKNLEFILKNYLTTKE